VRLERELQALRWDGAATTAPVGSFCDNCGHVAGKSFCDECGAPTAAEPRPAPAPAAELVEFDFDRL
jgi:hypothetical protein